MALELVYIINFSFAITSEVVGFIFSLSIVLIIATNRQCHSVNNFLICDLCLSLILLFLLKIIGDVFGLRDNWYFSQPFCRLRAYLISVMVTASTYSFLIQAISRLFFTVLHNQKFLLSWRTHRILIALKWLISFIICLQPFFINHGFALIEEYRTCATNTEIPAVGLYCISMIFLIPEIGVTTIYAIILYEVRQSSPRVMTDRPGSVTPASSSAKRNVKVMQRMMFFLIILVFGGAHYLILIVWDVFQYHHSVPVRIALIAANMVTLSVTILSIALFFLTKGVKDIAFRYFFKYQSPIR